ncbi:Triosephosphate isomerase [Labeo rohita]|uniref:Triosephosphate isomerase n=1 Tax=Labeo rohita TaxID=84645 RepID=A0ABQ8M3F4_LABRO|nr:Triosephosphate isomerase [Labeo rohita]
MEHLNDISRCWDGRGDCSCLFFHRDLDKDEASEYTQPVWILILTAPIRYRGSIGPCEKMQWKCKCCEFICDKDSADDHVFQELDLGILLVEREGAVSLSSLHLNPASFKIVIEGEVVMKSIKDLPKAMWLLFGLTYALHLSYPKPMKNTFQFIQQRAAYRTEQWHSAETQCDLSSTGTEVNNLACSLQSNLR